MIARQMAPPETITLEPRLYLCGFPKSGLHMVEQAVSVFVSPAAYNNWFGTFGEHAWSTYWINVERTLAAFLSLRPGQYAKGHTGYRPDIAQAAYSAGVGVLFIYRDLRDVLVSQAHHILRADGERLKHPGAPLYAGMTFEEILIACIEGLDVYAGLFDRWALYAGWLGEAWVLPVRFEDMRNNAGPTCEGIARYGWGLEAMRRGYGHHPPPEGQFKQCSLDMVRRVRDRHKSVTFRKGRTGGWKDAFTDRVKDCFKDHDPGWLVALGYETVEDW